MGIDPGRDKSPKKQPRSRIKGCSTSATLAVLALCCPCCGSGDSTASIGGFADAYAHAICARAATCCTADDFQTLVGGSQAACLQHVSANLNTNVQLVQAGVQRYDPVAGAECVQKIQSAACPVVFAAAHDASDPCVTSIVGASALGEACDGDYFCQSEDCEAQRCVTPPCTTGSCPAGQYCVVNTGCAAMVVEGNACTGDDMCGSADACLGSVCSPLLDDGVACSTNRQCKNATCGLVLGAAAKTCRQPYCQGP
jgi:hypothetical protein